MGGVSDRGMRSATGHSALLNDALIGRRAEMQLLLKGIEPIAATSDVIGGNEETLKARLQM